MDHFTVSKKWMWGFILSFLSAFLWATVYVAGRWIMRDSSTRIDPVTLSFLRFFFGAILLFIICFFTARKSLFAFSVKNYFRIAALSQFSFVCMSVFIFWGQRETSAINSTMIMSSSPIITMLLGLFIGEKISFRMAFGMLLSMIGCMFVVEVITVNGFAYSPYHVKGDLLTMIASFSWGLSAVLAKKIVTPGNDLAITAWSMLFASVTLFIINCFTNPQFNLPSDPRSWYYMIYLVLFATAFAFYAWNAAISRISLNLVNIMQYLTPILTVVLAWSLLGESLNFPKIAGIVLVLAGVVVSSAANLIRKDTDI